MKLFLIPLRPLYFLKIVFEEHYHEQCIQTPRLYDGIARLLQDLRAIGARLSVATNAPAIFATRMLTHLEIADTFDTILGSEDVKRPKPHPDMLQSILDGYGFAAARQDFAIMIGDNSKDMEAARNAGIAGAFVTWGFSPVGDGDYVLQHPDELLQLVQAAAAR